MLFNSIEFSIFLPIVFAIFWIANRGNSQRLSNFVLVLASYFFYGWWDWRFLFLIFASTLVDFSIGIALNRSTNQRTRKLLLWTSLGANLGLLGFFKYFNFFVSSFVSAFTLFGLEIQDHTLKILLPVGISFYTFQTLSYTIDVYRKKLEPTKDFLAFAAFVAFFPQLVAGPIERATNLLPQFYTKRQFDYAAAVDGCRQILWGLVKKILIADNCANLANYSFDNYETLGGSSLVLGAFFFAFQIYGDFSGYSDIAIGVSRLFGFNLMQNFATPYFSRDIAEFWRRWHISLSTWFRDYVYIPLGGSRGGTWSQIRNTFVVFVVSGLWHGANWTFVVWGGINALLFLPLLLLKTNRNYLDVVAQGRMLPTFKECFSIILTFAFTTLAWIFFRAENLTEAFAYLGGIFSTTIVSAPAFPESSNATWTLIYVAIFLLIEWLGREDKYAIEKQCLTWSPSIRYLFYYFLIIAIVMLGGTSQEFIYFQF